MNVDQLVLEQDPDEVVVTTSGGEVVHWNNAAESLFGYSRSYAVGESLNKLAAPVDPKRHEQILADVFRKQVMAYESVRHRQDGSLIYLDVTSKLVHDERGDFILHVYKDVTDMKVRRDAKLVEARFLNLLESTPDAIVMVNPSGRVVLANSQAEQLFGYERGELQGEPIEILLPESLRDAHVAHRSHYFTQPRTRAMGAGLELNGLGRRTQLEPARDGAERGSRHRREKESRAEVPRASGIRTRRNGHRRSQWRDRAHQLAGRAAVRIRA